MGAMKREVAGAMPGNSCGAMPSLELGDSVKYVNPIVSGEKSLEFKKTTTHPGECMRQKCCTLDFSKVQ